MTRKARKTESAQRVAALLVGGRIELPLTSEPRDYYDTAIAAAEEMKRLDAVREQAVRKLRELLGRNSFAMNKRLYQIRERNGGCYLVQMPLPGEVQEL